MRIITIQPAQTTSATAEYDPHKSLPYPYHIEPGGVVGRQDFWRGSPSRLMGFQRGTECRVVLTIDEFEKQPERAVGFCPVFIDEPSQSDKAVLGRDLHPSRSPEMWADTRPITRVSVVEQVSA